MIKKIFSKIEFLWMTYVARKTLIHFITSDGITHKTYAKFSMENGKFNLKGKFKWVQK